MSYWLWITLPLQQWFAALMLYIDFSLVCGSQEDEAFKGWSVRVKSFFTVIKKEYYTVIPFRLLEQSSRRNRSAKDGTTGSNELKITKSYPGYSSTF